MDQTSDTPLGKPVIAFSTGSLHCYGLYRCFALAKEAGFEAVEVMVDDRWDTRQAEYLASLRQQFAIEIACLHSPFLAHIPGWKSDEISRLKETLRIAEALDTRTVVTHLPTRWTRASLHLPFLRKSYHLHLPILGDGVYTRFLTEELHEFQAKTSVTIAIENMPYNHRILGRRASFYGMNNLKELERFDNINFDTTHLATHKQDILAVYDRLGPRVAHVHLSNYKEGREHQLLWDGVLPLDKFLRRLATNRFGGVVSVELEPGALEAGSEKRVKRNLKRSYEFCREHLGL